MSKPVLVDTETACVFIVQARGWEKTRATMKRASDHINYLAKSGQLTRHGGSKRGQARWDLKELARPYRKITIVPGLTNG